MADATIGTNTRTSQFKSRLNLTRLAERRVARILLICGAAIAIGQENRFLLAAPDQTIEVELFIDSLGVNFANVSILFSKQGEHSKRTRRYFLVLRQEILICLILHDNFDEFRFDVNDLFRL